LPHSGPPRFSYKCTVEEACKAARVCSRPTKAEGAVVGFGALTLPCLTLPCCFCTLGAPWQQPHET